MSKKFIISLTIVAAFFVAVSVVHTVVLEQNVVYAWGTGGTDDGGTGDSGGDGCGGCEPDVEPEPPYIPPTPKPKPEPEPYVPPTPEPKPAAVCIALTASMTTVPHNGANVTLTWNTSNATSVSINNGVGTVSARGSKAVFVNKTTTFVLTAVGAGGNDNCTVKVIVEAPKKPAVCDALTASRTTVPHNGANVTLTWNTTNATSVSLNNGIGAVAADGSRTVFVNANTTFILTAVGAGGNDDCRVTIKIQEKPKPVAVCDSLTSSKHTVPYGGGNVTLTWNTTNASSVSINNGVGTVAADGSKTVFVDKNTTFTLTAVGAGGNDNCTVAVKMAPAKAAVCDSLSASRYRVPHDGGNVTLTWNTTNADRVTINNGIGTVSADGSRSVFVDERTTFTLTAHGAGGNDDCQVTITLDNEPKKEYPSCDSFTADDYSIEEGDSVRLTWRTTNADSVRINQGVGSVAEDGSMTVYPNHDTTYVLTVSNAEGNDDCQLTIRVDEEEDDKRPVCIEFRASDTRVDEGDRITLSWETRDADELTIKAGSRTIYETSSASRVRDGSITVRMTEDTTFRLTVEGDRGRTDDCTVRVYVEEDKPSVGVTTTRDREPLTSIVFTQIPYTGFEAGPVVTGLFYALLALFAMVMSYILVVKRRSAFAGGRRMEHIRADDTFSASTFMVDAPLNLPIAMPVSAPAVESNEREEKVAIENRAFAEGVMLSPDALRAVMTAGEDLDGRLSILNAIITRAKETYPREDGWIALDQERVDALFR